MSNPIEDFENKSRLLSDDEKQLIRVLLSLYDACENLRDRVNELEREVTALKAGFGAIIHKPDK